MALKRDLLKEKLLNPRLFNTVYINIEDEKRERQEQMETLIELLCDERNKSSQTQVFDFLKREKKAVDLLMTAISEAKGDKKKLVATCWEADVDCDNYLPLLTDIVLNDELMIAMEALTTIENMRGHSPQAQIASSLAKAMEAYPKEANTPKGQLITDMIEVLRGWQQ